MARREMTPKVSKSSAGSSASDIPAVVDELSALPAPEVDGVCHDDVPLDADRDKELGVLSAAFLGGAGLSQDCTPENDRLPPRS